MTNQTKFNEFEDKLARSLHELEMLKSRFRYLVQEADELGLNTTENFWPINYLSGIHSDLVTAANRALNLYGEKFSNLKNNNMENRQKMITVTLYMDREDHERLKEAAEKVDRSVSNYCRQLLTSHSRALIQDKPQTPDAQQATIF